MTVRDSKLLTLLSISAILLCGCMVLATVSDDSDAVDGEYTVTFNGNGGTSVSATLTGTDITLPNATRDSTDKCTFTMLGWATTYNATEATYTVGSTYTATSDITLYAIWSATATGTSVDNDLGQKYSYSIQFVFSGADAESIFWSFGDGSTSTEWNPQHTYASKGTFYVIQTVYNSYNGGSSSTAVYKIEIMGFPVITFNSNGGSSVASIQQTAYGVVATEPTQPTKENCSFTGWYTDVDCTTAYVWTSVVRSSMTLYAGWSEDIYYTVTFNVNGGSSTVSSQNILSGEKVTLPSYTGTKTGYTFLGWTYLGNTYNAGVELTVSSDMDFVAAWTQLTTYTVTFNVNGGSTSVSSQTIVSGESVTIPSYSGTKTGYTFGGWSCNGTTYSAGQTVTVTSAMTFTAVWTANSDPTPTTYTVTFNVNGGSSSVASQTITSGHSVTIPTYSGTKAGYTFGGWSCNGTTYSAGQTVTVTSAMTFTAVWTANADPTPDEPNNDDKEDHNNAWVWIIAAIAILLVLLFLFRMVLLS